MRTLKHFPFTLKEYEAFNEKKEHDARYIILICHSCHNLIHEGYLKVALNQNNCLETQ